MPGIVSVSPVDSAVTGVETVFDDDTVALVGGDGGVSADELCSVALMVISTAGVLDTSTVVGDAVAVVVCSD
jgi:hypothetical protein